MPMSVSELSAYWVVIAINCSLAALVGLGAVRLWRWRNRLQALTGWLERSELSPSQLRFALTLRRSQLAQTRLALAQLQQRSRQAQQLLQLARLLRLVLLYGLRVRRWRR